MRSFICLLVLVGLVGGCGDQITFSYKSREEGLKLYNQQRYSDAAGAFRNAIKEQPRDVESQYYLGVCYDHLGKYPLAIAAYRSALESQQLGLERNYDIPFRMRIIDGLATAIAKSDVRGDLTTEIRNSTAADGRWEDKLLLARVLRYSFDHDGAIDAYRVAMDSTAPAKAAIAREFGLYLEQLAQLDQARSMLIRAYQLDDQDPQVQEALRRLNVVPGPSLKDPSALSQPVPELLRPASATPAGTTGTPRD